MHLGGPFSGQGAPNKYPTCSHGCNPPPALAPTAPLLGVTETHPPSPISGGGGAGTSGPHPKHHKSRGQTAPRPGLRWGRSPALGLGGGVKPCAPPAPPPNPEGSQLWPLGMFAHHCRRKVWGGGGAQLPWGREGPPSSAPPRSSRPNKVLFVKKRAPPSWKAQRPRGWRGGQHHPCRQGPVLGSGGGGWFRLWPPPKSLRHLPNGERGREDASGEDGDGLPSRGAEVGEEPFLGGRMGGGKERASALCQGPHRRQSRTPAPPPCGRKRVGEKQNRGYGGGGSQEVG